MLVHLQPETKVRIMAIIRRNSEQEKRSLKVVWHGEVVGRLHVLSVVETTQVNIVIAKHVVSSVDKRVTA